MVDTIIAAEVPEIRWVDFDLGQLDQEQPPVSWPCVLVGFDDSEFTDLSGNTQQGSWVIDLRVGFKLHERTHSHGAASYRAEALAHLDVVHKLHLAMQTASAECITDMTRTGIGKEKRADYRVYVLRYRVTAYEGPMTEDEKKYKNWKLYDTKPEDVDPLFEVVIEPES